MSFKHHGNILLLELHGVNFNTDNKVDINFFFGQLTTCKFIEKLDKTLKIGSVKAIFQAIRIDSTTESLLCYCRNGIIVMFRFTQ